jgi:type IV secretory pathway TraG/TraD family ATPase VirD4
MKRSILPIDKRVNFTLYIDEFQNFATESFAVILSEARKYNLSLVVANQYISQVEESVQKAIFGNV